MCLLKNIYYPVREYEVYWDYVPGLIWYYPDLGDDFPWLALQYLHDNNDDAALSMIAQYYNIPESDANYEMLRQYLEGNDNEAVMNMLRQYADNDVILPSYYSQQLAGGYGGNGSWADGSYSGSGSWDDGIYSGGGSFGDTHIEDNYVPEQYSPYYGWGDFNQADEEYLLLLRQQQGGGSF